MYSREWQSAAIDLGAIAALLERTRLAIKTARPCPGADSGQDVGPRRVSCESTNARRQPRRSKFCLTYGRKRKLQDVDRGTLHTSQPDIGSQVPHFSYSCPGLTGQPRMLFRDAAVMLADSGFAALSAEFQVCLRLLGMEPLAGRKRPLPLVAHAAFAAGEALALADFSISQTSVESCLAIYGSIPTHMRRAVLLQHLSITFALVVTDDPKKLERLAEICREHHAFHQAQQLTLELARRQFPDTPASVTEMYDFLTSRSRSEDLVLRWRDSLLWEDITEQFDKTVDHLAGSSLRHALILAARALEILRLKFVTSGEADDEVAIGLQAPLFFRLAAALGKDAAQCRAAADLLPLKFLTELYLEECPPTRGTLLASVSIALGVQYLYLHETVCGHGGLGDDGAESFAERVADLAAEFAWAKTGRWVPRWEGWLTRYMCGSKDFYVRVTRAFCRRGHFHVPLRLLDDGFDHLARNPARPVDEKESHLGALRVLHQDCAVRAASDEGRQEWAYEPAISDFMDHSVEAGNGRLHAKRRLNPRRSTRTWSSNSTTADSRQRRCTRLLASCDVTEIAAAPRKRSERLAVEGSTELGDVQDELGFGALDQEVGVGIGY